MRAIRILGGVAVLTTIGLVVWAVQSTPTTVRRPSGLVRLTRTIVIDPRFEMFSPASPSATPALTANEAFTQYALDNGIHDVTHPRVPVTVYLGIHAQRPNPTRPWNGGVLAYGFALRAGCVYSISPGSSPPPPRACIHWTFLNADTGHMIDETQQLIAGP